MTAGYCRRMLALFLPFSFWPLLPTHCRCRGLLLHLVTLKHTHTFGRTPLDEGPARRRDLYLTNTQHSQETDIHTTVGFEPTIPTSERPRTHTLDRATRCLVFDSKLLTDLYLNKISLARCCFLTFLPCWLLVVHVFPEGVRQLFEHLLLTRRFPRLCRGWKNIQIQNLTTVMRMHLQSDTSYSDALTRRYVWFGCTCKAIRLIRVQLQSDRSDSDALAKRYVWFGCTCKAIHLIRVQLQSDTSDSGAIAKL
jgi:hypothetical protein